MLILSYLPEPRGMTLAITVSALTPSAEGEYGQVRSREHTHVQRLDASGCGGFEIRCHVPHDSSEIEQRSLFRTRNWMRVSSNRNAEETMFTKIENILQVNSFVLKLLVLSRYCVSICRTCPLVQFSQHTANTVFCFHLGSTNQSQLLVSDSKHPLFLHKHKSIYDSCLPQCQTEHLMNTWQQQQSSKNSQIWRSMKNIGVHVVKDIVCS